MRATSKQRCKYWRRDAAAAAAAAIAVTRAADVLAQSAVSTLPALTLTFAHLSLFPLPPQSLPAADAGQHCVCMASAATHCRVGIHSSFSAHVRRVCRTFAASIDPRNQRASIAKPTSPSLQHIIEYCTAVYCV